MHKVCAGVTKQKSTWNDVAEKTKIVFENFNFVGLLPQGKN